MSCATISENLGWSLGLRGAHCRHGRKTKYRRQEDERSPCHSIFWGISWLEEHLVVLSFLRSYPQEEASFSGEQRRAECVSSLSHSRTTGLFFYQPDEELRSRRRQAFPFFFFLLVSSRTECSNSEESGTFWSSNILVFRFNPMCT